MKRAVPALAAAAAIACGPRASPSTPAVVSPPNEREPASSSPSSPSSISTPSRRADDDVFLGCAPEGRGGDAALNRKKNRVATPSAYEPRTLADVIAWPWPRSVEGHRPLATWTADEARAIEPNEARAIVVEGVLIDAKEEGEESANCHDRAHEQHDFHLWLAASADSPKSEAIVVEVTPRARATHPGWTLAAIRKLVRTKARVRVGGLVLFDPEHPEQLGKSRATLWEIHPITRIDVGTDSAFRALD